MDDVFFNKTFFWRLKISFLLQPSRQHFLGSTFLLLGLVGQLAVEVLAPSSKWASFSLAVISCAGVLIIVVADVVLASPWGLVASPLFFVGLFIQCIGKGLDSGLASSICGIVGICVIVLAMIFFFVGCKDTFRLPLIGSHNYVLFGGIMFISGAAPLLSALVSSILVLFPTVESSLRILALLLFTDGSIFFWCFSGLVALESSSMILHRYPCTAIFINSPQLARTSFIVDLAKFVFNCLVSISLMYIFSGNLIAASVGCFGMALCDGIKIGTFLFVRQWLLALSSGFNLVSMVLIGVVLLNPGSSYMGLGIASGICLTISSVLRIVRGILLGSKQYGATTGNYPFFQGMVLACSSAFLLAFVGVGLLSLLLFSFLLSQISILFAVLESSNSVVVSSSLNFSGPAAQRWAPDKALPETLNAACEWDLQPVVDEASVLIIGGGPAGLTAANELGIRGIKTILFDFKADVVPDSRFFLLNPATMEGVKRLNLAKKVLEAGQSTQAGWGSSMSDGMGHEKVTVFGNSPGLSREEHEHLGAETSKLSCSRSTTCNWASQPAERIVQSAQEAVLLEGARAYKCVSILFLHRFLDLRVSSDQRTCKALVRDETNGNLKVFQGKFLIGCDGGSSTVSHLLETKFDGFMHLAASRSIYIYSPELLKKATSAGLCESHQYHIVRKDVGVAYFALRDSIRSLWTFHLHVLFDGRSPASLDPDEMSDIVQEFAGPNVEFQVITDGRWRWNFAVARTFRKGPIFLAGDSCHGWPPFLGNGGNTAYQDVSNLCWKLEAFLSGWAHDSILESYDLERRDQVLRGAMAVIANTPSPTRLKIAGKLLFKAWTRFIVLAKWRHTTSGEHMGNNFCQNGLSYGCRYDFSPIILGGNRLESPPEDPFPTFIPKVVPGGRALHVRLKNGKSIHDLVSNSGYSIFRTKNLHSDFAERLIKRFQERLVPIVVHDIYDQLLDVEGERNKYAAALWIEQSLVIVRPDLYVSWTLMTERRAEEREDEIVKTLCGIELGVERIRIANSMSNWLTWRMYEGMKPLRNVFPKGVLVRNEAKAKDAPSSKAEVMQPDKSKSMGLENPGNKCEHCLEDLDPSEVCFMNSHQLHGRCLLPFRKRVGITEKVCAFCNRMLVGENIISLNKSKVHAECLSEFKSFSEQFKDQQVNF